MKGDSKRIKLFDMPVDAMTGDQVVAAADAGLRKGLKGRTLLAMNPEKIYALKENDELRVFFEKADILVPDGIGLVIALRLLKGVKLKRLTGTDLMYDLCQLASGNHYKVFFLGSKEVVNREAVEILAKQYPGIQVCGRHHGYIGEDEMDTLLDKINDVKPDIMFVALGSPRQEMWIQEYGAQLDVGIFQGVGGSLDTVTGHVKRAHPFIQKIGLEWLSRLLREPKRWRRQLILPRFALRVLCAKVGIVKR